MLQKLLIANRGEIACRIMKTAKKMGIATVAVYSEADAHAKHVSLADEAYCIGEAPAQKSYLCAERIVAVALQSGADAIHPGYGFLAEQAEFAALCEKNHIIFVGPNSQAIAAMGSKSRAKILMQAHQIPTIPGYEGKEQEDAHLIEAAEKIGLPVLLKAASGGGGRGMRLVEQETHLIEAIHSAKREALSSFGDAELLIEKYLPTARHVELQIFVDQQGQGIYLSDRDCSVQRRHQKIIEEAPAPGLSDSLRKKMGETAIKAAQAIQYCGAGTVEFLLDDDGHFYFMEMNTRLQVEHPVTELITGTDLVEWQIKIASGDPLPLTQTELKQQGHAFEVRICAEDPFNQFVPATGKITHLIFPEENSAIRIDSGIREKDIITPYYDSMIAKLIVWGESRQAALETLQTALTKTAITGVSTNTTLLSRIIREDNFSRAEIHTRYLTEHPGLLNPECLLPAEVLAIAALTLDIHQKAKQEDYRSHSLDIHSPWWIPDHWRAMNQTPQSLHFWQGDHPFNLSLFSHLADQTYTLHIQEQPLESVGTCLFERKIQQTLVLKLIRSNRFELDLLIDGIQKQAISIPSDHGLNIFYEGTQYTLHTKPPGSGELLSPGENDLTSPMPGTLIDIQVKVGDRVNAGDRLAILEAMKMEHSLHAPYDGIVSEIFYTKGATLPEGVELLKIEKT